MAALTFDLEIWIDGNDEPVLVRADQRDIAAFEVEHKTGLKEATKTMPITFFRYLGWHAMRRVGKIDPGKSRQEWLDTVSSVEPEDEPEEEPEHPGSPAA